jgi:hypothetical protein
MTVRQPVPVGSRPRREEPEAPAQERVAGEKVVDEIDTLLDEIDAVLEEQQCWCTTASGRGNELADQRP